MAKYDIYKVYFEFEEDLALPKNQRRTKERPVLALSDTEFVPIAMITTKNTDKSDYKIIDYLGAGLSQESYVRFRRKMLIRSDDLVKKMGHLQDVDIQKIKSQKLDEAVKAGDYLSNDEYNDVLKNEVEYAKQQLDNPNLSDAIKRFYSDRIKQYENKLNEDINVEIPVQEGPAFGLSEEINALIKDEYEAIEGYNTAIVNMSAEGYDDAVKILSDIQAEEHIHVGQLQELMKLFDANADKVDDGQAEAEEQLTDSVE